MNILFADNSRTVNQTYRKGDDDFDFISFGYKHLTCLKKSLPWTTPNGTHVKYTVLELKEYGLLRKLYGPCILKLHGHTNQS